MTNPFTFRQKAVGAISGIVGIILTVAFFAALLIVPPFITLLAINTIFSTAIKMTFGRWLAIVWIGIYLSASTRGSKS